jgi:phospholipid/cholesterol/gamma-HCH transport system ATP-binding protein
VRLAGDRVVILVDGRCYASDSYAQLAKNKDPKVKQFFE